MLMIHGLGLPPVATSGSYMPPIRQPPPLPKSPRPTAPTTSWATKLKGYASTTAASSSPSTSGCPAGYVQSEFGCMVPTAPNAPCPAGSIQTGYGCLPSNPPGTPTVQPRTPASMFPNPPAPQMDPPQATDPTVYQTPSQPGTASVQSQVVTPPSDTKTPPGQQVNVVDAGSGQNPITATAQPMSPMDYPVAPTAKPINKALVAAGVLGVAGLIAAAIFGHHH